MYFYSKSGGPFHAIATYPAYQSLYENLRTLNCDLDYWTVTDTEAGWDLSLDQLNQLIKPTTKLLVLNFPHSPTGFVPTSERWKAIVELCRSRGIFLFSDEMYRLSNNDGTEALMSGCAMYENAVTLCGMSKTFALPGLRIGWLATKCKELMEMMGSFKDYTTICSPGPCELLAIIGERERERDPRNPSPWSKSRGPSPGVHAPGSKSQGPCPRVQVLLLLINLL